ncbi:MAG: uracil-DNA glycosylase [Phycisphaerae bacterium]|nr:uracil-DNA glycosylase [Phycisphaerae bacterium]
MPTEPAQQQRLAKQQLETEALLGVDFIPVNTTGKVDEEGPVILTASETGSNDCQKAPLLASLKAKVEAEFPLCPTLAEATQPVFGEGDPEARLMFIGEAPGAEEDRTGRPFVGAAGKKLGQMIESMGLQREDVYIANILKARPPDNRTPTSEEIEASAPYLVEQIRIIQPAAIVTLGSPSTKFVLKTKEGITRLRGRWASWIDDDLHIPVMPTFHPAYLLRNYTKETRNQVWSDLQKVMELLGLK